MREKLSQITIFLLILLIWQIVVWSEVVPSYILPSVTDVFLYLEQAVKDHSIVYAFTITMRRLLFGYSAALILGVPLGFMCAHWKVCSDSIGLLAVSAQALPSVCWVPFALLSFGQSEWAMLFVVLMGSVGSIILAVESSIKHIPKLYIEAARTMGSEGLHTARNVLLPAAMPEFFSGMKQGWAFAWRSLMAAEIYVSVLSGLGLGQLLHYGRELHAMDQVLGVMLVILCTGLLLERLIFVPIQKSLRRKRGIL